MPGSPLFEDTAKTAEISSSTSAGAQKPKQLRADLALLFITLIWGATFPVVKGALADVSPFLFLVFRFLLAGVLFAILFRKKIFPLDLPTLRAGAALGLFLFLGFALQTYGLVYTSSSRSAFMTSLLVLWVPFISLFVEKERPAAALWAAIGVAIAGMWFLNRPEAGALNRGDWFSVACAFFLPFKSFS